MSKAPAFQFYPADWQRDLEEHPLEIEGAWIRICCKLWWSETRGKLTRSVDQWAKILRVYPQDAERIINYINSEKIGDVLTDSNGNLTVISRRMMNDEKERINNCLRQKRHYDKNKPNAPITPTSQYSSSSSSSSKKKESNKEKVEFANSLFQNIPETLMSKWKESCPGIDIKREIAKAEAWVISNPKLKKSNWSRFLTNWMVRAQDHAKGAMTNEYRNNGNRRYGRSDAVPDASLDALARAEEEYERAKAAAPGGSRRAAVGDDVPDFAMQ